MANKKRRNRIWIAIFVVVVILLVALKLGGCLGGKNAVKVTLEPAAKRNIIQTVDASGKIYPENEVLIKADVSGEIVALPVEEGDSVTKGQLLMKIDPVIYQTEVSQSKAQLDRAKASLQNTRQMAAQAKAQYDEALSDFNRNQQLYHDKVISTSEFEQLKSKYLSAKAAYKAAKANVSAGKFSMKSARAAYNQSHENLNRTIIKAPASGIISQLSVKNGERVVGTQQMDGSQLMTIADLKQMEVRVNVNETDISKVSLGDTAAVSIDAFRNKTFKGVVSKISVSSVALSQNPGNALSSGANTDQVTNYTVHVFILPKSYAKLQEKTGKKKFLIKPGMSAAVAIQTKQVDSALSVPINAVTTRDLSDKVDSTGLEKDDSAGNSMQMVVFVYDKITGEVNRQKVTTGIQDNEYIQIKTGLKKGDKVVIAPYSAIARTLKDKTSVHPVSKDKLYQNED